jgi:sigma-B regulation protein RsbU (phosphoserine phosphatase)
MSKPLKSFSGRLTRIIVIIVLVTMTTISMLAFGLTASAFYTSFKEHFADAIENISRSITLNLEKVEIAAANIADEVTWHISSPEIVVSTLMYEIKVNHSLTGCGVGFIPDYFPEKGRWFEPYARCTDDGPVVQEIGSASHDYHLSEWFTSGLSAPGGIWSRPYLDPEGAGTLLCTYSLPIMDSEGKVVGVLGADLSLIWLANLLHEIDVRENASGLLPAFMKNKDHGIYSFILGPEGEYIAHPDRARFLGERNYFDYEDAGNHGKYRMVGEAMCEGKTGEETVLMDGRKYEVFFAPLSDSGWSMAIAVPLISLLMPALTFGSASLLLTLLGLLIVFLISRSAIKRFTRPLVQLADSATEVARGKFDTPLPVIQTEDEIRLLRDSFDNMQQSLSKYIVDLTEATAQRASMENELDVARKIQMSMLPLVWPAFPDRVDIDIYGGVTPAKAVGGDLYDFCLRDGKLYFCIGDVSGKGIPASLVMTVVSSLFRTLSDSEDSPDKLVSVINSSMSARNENLMFVTLFVGRLDLETGELNYCNAGHNAPFVMVDGVPRVLEADANVPVGIVPEWKFSLQSTVLPPGSVLFLYTDGLTEAARIDGTLFGEAGVLSRLAGLKAAASAKEIVVQMREAVEEFVGDAEQSDDLTLLVIRRT